MALVLENFLDTDTKRFRDQECQLKRWVVFPLFQRDDGLTSDSYTISQCLLRQLASLES